uniref:Uncharacterized protein n=1 Tax=Avena sativa TaxID=4498 RepID=A0ACD5W2D3_AVESA
MTRQPGNDLAELLWEDGPALRRTLAAPFPPFACTAAGTSRAQEPAKHPASATAMRDLLGAPDDDAVPWLHYPGLGVDDDDSDTAPLPPEYCSTLLSGYPGLPDAGTSRDAPSTSHCAVVVPPPPPPLLEPAAPRQQPPRPSGEGIMNFTFFSRPLQRPPPTPPGERASAGPSNPVESTVLQASTNRLRSTPLFSEQRMAWLQPPRDSRATVAPVPPTPPVPIRQGEAPAALLTQRIQPEARAPERPPPPPATATTSSVCSDNVDRSQLKRSSGQQAPEWSVSQEDEDLDEEAGGLRRSAARSTKRGRTAEVHNMSERRRRDRINEKMRALQELIPNCNKIDKASMLEEAIEYLKTLQLQVQMMSTMGPAGLCMPPMMAMQHMQMPTMAHFHHHHLGAMAGFGMGAFDPRLVAAAAAPFPYPMMPGMPMFGHGHTMPSPPPFPQQQAAAAGAHAGTSIVDNDGTAAAAAQADQQTPSDDPHAPQAM